MFRVRPTSFDAARPFWTGWVVALPLLVLIASLLAPLAVPMHALFDAQHVAHASAESQCEEADHSLIGHSAHGDDFALGGDPTHNEHPAHAPAHDPTHCALCVALSALKVLAVAAASISLLAIEAAPEWRAPNYLAPTVSEPSLLVQIPRGPPALA